MSDSTPLPLPPLLPTEISPPMIPASPHEMTDRELLIEAVTFARSHGARHVGADKRLEDGDRLFRQVDAEIEMCMRSIETLCRINHAHEAAEELGTYLREKRLAREARDDAANGHG